jgi:hypothetical protein
MIHKRRVAHFSENWGILSVFPVLGGNVLSIAFGRNLDAHASPAQSMSSSAPPSIDARQCLAGRECYVQTLYLNLGACAIALCLSIWAGRRDWLDWQARDQRGEWMDTVEWEDAGEAVGPDDLHP